VLRHVVAEPVALVRSAPRLSRPELLDRASFQNSRCNLVASRLAYTAGGREGKAGARCSQRSLSLPAFLRSVVGLVRKNCRCLRLNFLEMGRFFCGQAAGPSSSALASCE